MPVGKGLKFAANFWIHLYDFQVYFLWLHLLWLSSLCRSYGDAHYGYPYYASTLRPSLLILTNSRRFT